MSQVLVILNEKELSTIIQGKLSQKYGLEVIVKNSSTDAISILQILPDVQLILCQDKIGLDPVASKMGDFLTVNKDDFPKEVDIVILGEKTTHYPKAVSIGPNPPYQKIIDYIGFLLGKETKSVSFEPEPEKDDAEEEKTTVFQLPKIGKKPAEEKEEVTPKVIPDYHAFHIKYFSNLSDSTFDFSIFTRIKKQNDYEYNQKIAANSTLTRADLDRIALRMGKEFFVTNDDFKKANDFLNTNLLNKFKNPNLSLQDRIQLNSDCYEILMDAFKDTSFDKYSVEIIKEMVKSIDLLVKNPDGLTIFLKAYAAKKATYGYFHTHLTCLLIFLIVDKFPWSKDQSKNKIIYLSLFHDLCLHSDRLVKLHHHYFHELKNLSEEEKQIMQIHADSSANILETIVKAPKELTTLVREHHGLKNGKGFIESLSIAIAPLSMAFIVTEDFVTQFLDLSEKLEKDKEQGPTKQQLESVFTELKKKYEKHTYHDVAVEFQKYFNAR